MIDARLQLATVLRDAGALRRLGGDLEARGLLVSSGSACSAGSTEPSHVLTAMGLPPEVATTAVRFSLAPGTTAEQVDDVVAAVREVVGRLLGARG